MNGRLPAGGDGQSQGPVASITSRHIQNPENYVQLLVRLLVAVGIGICDGS
jgi:hypothetical protein